MNAPTRTRIKMCGFTREADVDAAVQAGADAIGFVLYPPSPRAVSIDRAEELATRLPAFVTPVHSKATLNPNASQLKGTPVLATAPSDEQVKNLKTYIGHMNRVLGLR